MTPEDCPADYTKDAVLDAMATARAASKAEAGPGDTSDPTLADVLADAQATAEAEYDAANAARAAAVAAGFGDPIHPTTGNEGHSVRSRHIPFHGILRFLAAQCRHASQTTCGRQGAPTVHVLFSWQCELDDSGWTAA